MADQVVAALNRTAASLTPRLQRKAADMGWPENLASSLTVQIDDNGNTVPKWPAELEQDILDMDGGSPSQAPRPALHMFFHDSESQRDIRQEAARQASDLLLDLARRMF